MKSILSCAFGALMLCNSTAFAQSFDDGDVCPAQYFARQATVFDVLTICATADVPEAKVEHAANVAAEWLDNDGDGLADEPDIIEAMAETQPLLLMTGTEPSEAFYDAMEPLLDDHVLQDLYADETDPPRGRRDASQEEIHHLILNAGWAVAYPETFAPEDDTALFRQWELAEAKGYYDYDDPTCDAECRVTEFAYLASAAYLDAEEDLQTDELVLKSDEALRESLPGIVWIMENGQYGYPVHHWPSGHYPHQHNITYD